MKYIEVRDLSCCPVSERNGMYGGRGFKEGITIDGEYWIVKYSQNAFEYIGSGIYRILGIETQEVMLGVRNDRLVAACKDFCKREGALREVRKLRNIHSKELSERLENKDFTIIKNDIKAEYEAQIAKYRVENAQLKKDKENLIA